MDVASVQKLCIHLISAAFQRCRVCEDLCRLSVVLRCSSAPNSSIVRVSISDTGIGSSLEEFQDLRFGREVIDVEKWDGLLSVRTTSMFDDEVYHYHLNLRESISARRLTRLPSNPKSGVKFSGTEVCLSFSESIDVFLAEFNYYFQKILILKIPNVAIELVVERGDLPGSRYENVLLANECNSLPFSASNVERLKSGLEDYVLKHGNTLPRKCDSCFPSWEHLKVGNGVACSTETQGNSGMLMEVIIIISELSENSSCIRACGPKTEILYFKDFTPCSINQICLTALTAVDWKSYGLALERAEDQGGHAILVWENLPPDVHIDMVLHCYHKQYKLPLSRKKTRPNQNLIKKAIKLALDDLKEKHAGVLLSAQAVKICSYAPDLARSIAGLILSSNDSQFQGECLTLLGLKSQHIDGGTVEGRIKEKIISVIETNDRKPQKSKDVAPFLFEDGGFQEMNLQVGEYDTGEHLFSSLDF